MKKASQGGSANKIAVGVEPNVAYVQGFRNENLGTTYIDVDKPRDATNDTATETGTVTQLVSGNYIRLDRTGASSGSHSAMKGLPPIDNLDTIDLHNVRIAETQSGSNKIGTARVKEIVRFNDTEAQLYLFDITMSAIDANNNYNFSAVESVSYADSGSQDFIADLKAGFEGKRFKSSKSGAVWKLPYDAVKEVPTVTYEVRKRQKVNVTSGAASISTGTGEAFEDAAADLSLIHI